MVPQIKWQDKLEGGDGIFVGGLRGELSGLQLPNCGDCTITAIKIFRPHSFISSSLEVIRSTLWPEESPSTQISVLPWCSSMCLYFILKDEVDKIHSCSRLSVSSSHHLLRTFSPGLLDTPKKDIDICWSSCCNYSCPHGSGNWVLSTNHDFSFCNCSPNGKIILPFFPSPIWFSSVGYFEELL